MTEDRHHRPNRKIDDFSSHLPMKNISINLRHAIFPPLIILRRKKKRAGGRYRDFEPQKNDHLEVIAVD
jgi:hypothetical protein